jgi:hypothetical protein
MPGGHALMGRMLGTFNADASEDIRPEVVSFP